MEKSGSSSFDIRKEGLMPQEETLEVGTRKKQLKIGIPSEDHSVESRVPLTPEAVEILTGQDHEVILESGAGNAANYLGYGLFRKGRYHRAKQERSIQQLRYTVENQSADP